MSAVTRTHPIWRPQGQTIQIDIGGSRLKGYLVLPSSRSGPGLVLAHHRGEPDAAVRALCEDYAEEGYVVLAPELPTRENPAAALGAIEAARQALMERRERKGRIAVLGHGRGGSFAVSAAARFGFDALAAYDPDGATLSLDDLARVSCPLVLQFGTRGDPAAETTASRARSAIKAHQDARVYAYADAAPHFVLKGGDTFDKRIAAIAHTRTLDVIRRVLGPHYDYVSLFAEHAHHEFVTRDANKTMATMVDEPYVNHVPTLTGGVGHDLLKRFYKYHFVNQNSGERDNTPVSYTVGGNRLVIEQVVRFKHDRVIDRMYPGIEPTHKEVEIPLVICVTFRGDKVAHEHLYWDQACALAQIGLIDTGKLPVAGREQAAKLLDETLPSNELMARSWETSEGKPA